MILVGSSCLAQLANFWLTHFYLEMITEDYPKSTIKSHLTSLTTTNASKPSADTVDLTIDSDEEEEPLKKSVQKAKNGM